MPPVRPAPFLLLAVFVAGCGATDVREAQRLFEAEAFTLPASGFTETPDGVTVRDEDPQDWRIAPRFLGDFELTLPPYPNPVGRGESIQLLGTFADRNGALIPYRLTRDGDLLRIEGACVSGSTLAPAPVYTVFADCIGLGESGLFRLVLLDGRGDVVTYGDVSVAR